MSVSPSGVHGSELVPARLWRLGLVASRDTKYTVFLARGLSWSRGADLLGRVTLSSAAVVPVVLVVDPMPSRDAIQRFASW